MVAKQFETAIDELAHRVSDDASAACFEEWSSIVCEHTVSLPHTDLQVVAKGTSALNLIGLELVHTPYVAEGSPHLFHGSHVFERRFERFSGRLHSIHRGVTGSLGCGSCLLTSAPCGFTGLPQMLPFFTKCFERLAMAVAHLPRFFRESSELLCLSPGRLG
jgi:hypothetical protein